MDLPAINNDTDFGGREQNGCFGNNKKHILVTGAFNYCRFSPVNTASHLQTSGHLAQNTPNLSRPCPRHIPRLTWEVGWWNWLGLPLPPTYRNCRSHDLCLIKVMSCCVMSQRFMVSWWTATPSVPELLFFLICYRHNTHTVDKLQCNVMLILSPGVYCTFPFQLPPGIFRKHTHMTEWQILNTKMPNQ